jgi:hypothetical protein
MPKIKIVVSGVPPVPPPTPTPPPQNPPLGSQETFTDDLVLQQYNNRTPGNGPNDLPPNPAQRLAGTHSGTLTLLRIAGPGDRFYPPGTYVIQYVATYKFNNLPNTPLAAGQVTTHGVLLLDSNNNFAPLETPNKFAITGGTDAYDLARGEVSELQNPTNDKDLEIDV